MATIGQSSTGPQRPLGSTPVGAAANGLVPGGAITANMLMTTARTMVLPIVDVAPRRFRLFRRNVSITPAFLEPEGKKAAAGFPGANLQSGSSPHAR
jgi:hypothetical protein